MDQLVELRAVVRREMLDRVVHCLKDSGLPRLTVVRCHAVGAGVDPASAKISVDEATYADKALLQFICPRERSEMFADLIARTAHTGRRGDGIVYVQPVLAVIKIRTGAQGLEALQ